MGKRRKKKANSEISPENSGKRMEVGGQSGRGQEGGC